MRKRKYRILLVVLLVGLAVTLVAGPTFAALVWEEVWNHTTSQADLFRSFNDPNRFHSYGWWGWESWGETTQVWVKEWDCNDYEEYRYDGERIWCFASDSDPYTGSVRCRMGCAWMTETPCPTMPPYPTPTQDR